MKNLRLALFGGSALLLAVSGFGVIACSSDDSSGFPVSHPTVDSGKGTGDDQTDDDGDDTTPDATTGSKDGGADTGTGTIKDSGGGTQPDGGGGFQEIQYVDGGPDIYACGGPGDCTGAGQNCYIQAYPDWDGGNFYSSKGKCSLIAADGITQCKTSAQALSSDTQVCGELDGGAFTPCPQGTTCQPVAVFGKNFGACLEPNGSFDAGCGNKFVPYADEANYCFSGATVPDGGCVAPSVVCCDKDVGGTFQNSCVSDPSSCSN